MQVELLLPLSVQFFFVFKDFSIGLKEKRTTFVQGTNGLSPMCPLFGGFTVKYFYSTTFNSACNSQAELEGDNYPSNILSIFIPSSSANLSRCLVQP